MNLLIIEPQKEFLFINLFIIYLDFNDAPGNSARYLY